MSNKTQCPSCSSVFLISDEQLEKSRGKVRCGRCRHEFRADLLYSEDKATDEQMLDRSTRSDLFENIQPNLRVGIDDDDPDYSTRSHDLISEVNELIAEQWQTETEDVSHDLSGVLDVLEEPSIEIEESEFVEPESESAFYLDKDKRLTSLQRWLVMPLLSVLSLVLLLALLYQLWWRQALPMSGNETLNLRISSWMEPVNDGLQDLFGWQLPERQDLANLRLVSARVEPHPQRASTTLLKVSVANQSDIPQPYPVLELTLDDENGRLVSRRTLPPKDYLHNNRLNDLIGAKELRPVTIELLAFPRQAHGYELKIVTP